MKSLISNPYITILVVLVLWYLIYTFLKWKDLSEKGWRKLEFIWIFSGLLGLIGIVSENGKLILEGDNAYLKANLRFNIVRVKRTLEGTESCFQFTTSPNSPDDLVDRQYDQDLICEWSKKFKYEIDTYENLPLRKIDVSGLENIKLKTDMMLEYKSEFTKLVNEINRDLELYHRNEDIIKSDSWKYFYQSFGLIFLMLAISLRLAIASRNLSKVK